MLKQRPFSQLDCRSKRLAISRTNPSVGEQAKRRVYLVEADAESDRETRTIVATEKPVQMSPGKNAELVTSAFQPTRLHIKKTSDFSHEIRCCPAGE
jgi:hypothetical protein